jgi:hypothetical protein
MLHASKGEKLDISTKQENGQSVGPSSKNIFDKNLPFKNKLIQKSISLRYSNF